MSAYTTIYLTRAQAVKEIMTFLLEADNKQIEDMADVALRDRLYNCIIVPEGSDVR